MVKISVFLDEQVHRSAKVAAIDASVSLSQWVAALVAKQLHKASKRKQAA